MNEKPYVSYTKEQVEELREMRVSAAIHMQEYYEKRIAKERKNAHRVGILDGASAACFLMAGLHMIGVL